MVEYGLDSFAVNKMLLTNYSRLGNKGSHPICQHVNILILIGTSTNLENDNQMKMLILFSTDNHLH